MNQIFNNLVTQNYLNFKNSFKSSKNVFWDTDKKRLIHAGEFGAYREKLAKRWLKTFVPGKFGLGNGFVITAKNRVSSQCDIIFYDKNETPLIENDENQKFFPIETVAGIIEVKSDINSISELNAHLIKLSELKKFREDVKDPAPYNRGGYSLNYNLERVPFDNIFTILLCNKLNFQLKTEMIDYGTIPVKYHHNLVLSLNDGIINYTTEKGTENIFFSFMGDEIHKISFLEDSNDSEPPLFVKNFLNSLYYLLKSTCLHKLDTSYYFVDKPTDNVI